MGYTLVYRLLEFKFWDTEQKLAKLKEKAQCSPPVKKSDVQETVVKIGDKVAWKWETENREKMREEV